jgi:hypothetical protein
MKDLFNIFGMVKSRIFGAIFFFLSSFPLILMAEGGDKGGGTDDAAKKTADEAAKKAADDAAKKGADDKTDWKAKAETETKEREKLEKKLKDKEDSDKKAADEKLKKDGEYKTLAEQRETELKTAQEKLLKTNRNHSIDIALLPGLKNPEYLKLADYDSVEIDKDGKFKPEEVASLAKAYKEKHPELYGEVGGKPGDSNYEPNKADKGKDGAAKSFGAQLAEKRNTERSKKTSDVDNIWKK